MNVTLLSLSLSRSIIPGSPFLCTAPRRNLNVLNIRNALFSSKFQPILFSDHAIHLEIDTSKFQNLLKGGIVIDSSSQVTSPLPEYGNETVSLVNIMFINCSTDERSGGAILVNGASAQVKIVQCCFYSCSTTNVTVVQTRFNGGGGAVFLHALRAIYERNSHVKCMCTAYRALATYIGTYERFTSSLCSFSQSESTESGCVYLYERSPIYLSKYNSSYNYLLDGSMGSFGTFLFSPHFEITLSNFMDCAGKDLYFCVSMDNHSLFRNCNFIRCNSCDSVMFQVLNCTLTVEESGFYEIPYFFYNGVSVTFVDCLSDNITVPGFSQAVGTMQFNEQWWNRCFNTVAFTKSLYNQDLSDVLVFLTLSILINTAY